MPTTTRGFRYPPLTGAGSDPDVPRDIANLASDIDTQWTHGLLADRPAASMSKVGRRYYAEDNGIEYLDLGTGWVITKNTAIGTAGGVLSGSYPNPDFAQDMATQTELNNVLNGSTPHDILKAVNAIAARMRLGDTGAATSERNFEIDDDNGVTELQARSDDWTAVYWIFLRFIHATGQIGVNGTPPQSAAKFASIFAGDGIEWGHTNLGGYRCHLGAESGTGKPYIAFNCEAGTNVNTYKTRGMKGFVIRAEMDGGITWNTVDNVNADNQTLTPRLRLDASGRITQKTVGCRLWIAPGVGDLTLSNPGGHIIWISATEAYDTDNFHNGNSADVIIPAGLGGVYTLSATVAFEARSGGVRNIEFLVNGALIGAAASSNPVVGDETRLNISTDVALVPGDVVNLDAFHNSGSSILVKSDRTSMSLTRNSALTV